ncbi:subunit 17 of mediator complex-domain-containing protein [Absidia repens]|uniref:Mediator of RNA polymerase II transcription subunit 17 n=1 Tax=Absidia repens TaxID=90262 RepID=A0A1X2IZI3_9FUNG|nr:subunit 17 of mediator complex-domain-containing protein [Absidia repens]
MEEYNAKRIKLSLEPFINKAVADVTDTGHEVFKTDLSLPEQLMRNVDRVWYERGDWMNITEEGLQRQLTSSKIKDDTTTAIDTTTPSSTDESSKHQQKEQHINTGNLKNDQEALAVDLGKLRESVISKLYFAKCEIDVALDVMNILSTENKRNTNGMGVGGSGAGGILAGINGAAGGLGSILGGGLGSNDSGADGNNNMVLPPGTLHATYVSKPKPTEKAQLEHAQLTLGLKRTQQKTAAAYLKKSAASLKTMVEEEQEFWDQAVCVRSNHWLMQASGNTSGLWISYGFKDVGSDFPEACHGEMLRPDQNDETDTKNQVRLSLPHNIPKLVRVTVKRNRMEQHGGETGRIFDLEQGEEKIETAAQGIYPSIHNSQDNSIQRRLIDAQSTVYDAELFSRILSEAQVIPSNIQCEEDYVIVTLGGEMDIVIQKMQYNHQQQWQQTHDACPSISSQQMVGRTIETALRLLLVQRHRFNLWKSRTRLMAGQRKIQLLLDAIEDTTSSTGSGAKSTGSSSFPGAGSNLNSSISGASGVGGSHTPKLGHRTASNISTSGGTSSSSLSRKTTGSGSYQLHTSREPTSNVPILAPVISMTRFWILFDGIRDVVLNTVNPLCGETGLGLSVHFKPQHEFKSGHQAYCDAYPSFGELSTSLAINMYKGSSLQFALNQTGTITAISPGNIVTLSNVTEFEAFLLREIKLICLHLVCDIANDLIRRSPAYKKAKGNDRDGYIWQVEEVEEILYGAVQQSGNWKNIQIQLNRTTINHNSPAYVLQIQEEVLPPIVATVTNNHVQQRPKSSPQIKRFILLSQWNDSTMDGDHCDLGFRDKVVMMVAQLLE